MFGVAVLFDVLVSVVFFAMFWICNVKWKKNKESGKTLFLR